MNFKFIALEQNLKHCKGHLEGKEKVNWKNQRMITTLKRRNETWIFLCPGAEIAETMWPRCPA